MINTKFVIKPFEVQVTTARFFRFWTLSLLHILLSTHAEPTFLQKLNASFARYQWAVRPSYLDVSLTEDTHLQRIDDGRLCLISSHICVNNQRPMIKRKKIIRKGRSLMFVRHTRYRQVTSMSNAHYTVLQRTPASQGKDSNWTLVSVISEVPPLHSTSLQQYRQRRIQGGIYTCPKDRIKGANTR